MTLRFTTKAENIKAFVYLKHGQMSIKCIFVLNYLFWSLIIQASMDNQAPKKEHLMKSGILGFGATGGLHPRPPRISRRMAAMIVK
jgi:hypothetical protein